MVGASEKSTYARVDLGPLKPRCEGERGFSFILTAMCLVVMIGMMGLVIDVGQMFVAKNELQAYVDAAALAAALQLDGTPAGVARAEAKAKTGPLGSTMPNGINYGTTVIPASDITTGYRVSLGGVTASYTTAAAGPYPNGYRFVVLSATRSIGLNFIPIVGAPINNSTINSRYTVTATAIAGQMAIPPTAGASGLSPFTPAAHNPADLRNWGLTPGTSYTLKWGNNNATDCAGDLSDPGFNPRNLPDQHGYIDLGQGSAQGGRGSGGLSGAIQYDSCPNCPYHIGDSVDGVTGNRAVSGSDVGLRAVQDSDQSSTNWADYAGGGAGNNRRIITVPMHDPANVITQGGQVTYTIIGFASFLLAPAASYNNTSDSICATYIGPATTYSGTSAGSTSTSVYKAVLFQ